MPAERRNLKLLCRTCFHSAKPGKFFSLQSQPCLPDPETVEEMLLTVVPELVFNKPTSNTIKLIINYYISEHKYHSKFCTMQRLSFKAENVFSI